MPEHNCTQSENIKRLEESNEKILEILHGRNPPPGILERIGILSIHVEKLNEGMPTFNRQVDELLNFKKNTEACGDKRWKNIQTIGLFLGIFCSVLFSTLSFMKSSSNATDRENTVVTDPATLEQALRAGKNPKFRNGSVLKQYEKNYNEGIKDMNK
jgi:hypothetical protein